MADWDVYLEDSGTSKPGIYMGLGGVMLKTHQAKLLSKSIGEWRDRLGITTEIAWKKTTRDRVESYKTFCKGALHYVDRGDMAFSCALFNREHNRHFSREEKNAARDRFVYQILLHGFALRVNASDRIFIYPDKDLIRGSVSELRDILNAGIAKATKAQCVQTVRAIQPQHSHTNHFIQMADILVGSVTTANNRLHDINSSRGAAKQSVIDHIEALSGISLREGKQGVRSPFDVWFFKPRKEKASADPNTSAVPRVHAGHTTL